MGMAIETKRLILRPWEENDVEDLFACAKDPEIGPLCGWKPHRSRGESREILHRVLMVLENYAIVEKESGRVIGSAGLHSYNNSNIRGLQPGDMELGYWLGRPYWGKGYATEAGAALLRRAFVHLGAACVWAEAFEENCRSHRVQEKLGFKYCFSEFSSRGLAPCDGIMQHVRCLDRVDYNSSKNR